ncbi:MAG: DUF1549 and DUF1553 domain-containing protein [Bryobacteraceae bacterium]
MRRLLLLGITAVIAFGADAPKPKYSERQRNFWSFRPIQNPAPPTPQDAVWARSAIDRFVLSKMEAKGLKPAAPVSKEALLRRATYDLIGLPPTPDEIKAFLADQSPRAFEKVVDRLLASPRYGERWGRHWLDVARYADSTGADEDHRYPYAWRYRDYVIAAFNRDLPYDRFVMEQVAGDLLPPPAGKEVNEDGIVATGFLSIGPRLIAEQDKVKMLYDFIDEQIDTTTRGLLGLTVACSRCHDHKFDPIATKDYYSLAAIFANSKSFSKIGTTGVSEIYYAPTAPSAEVKIYQAHQAKILKVRREIEMRMYDEAARFAAPLRSQVAIYMRAVFEGKSDGLDAGVLARWQKFLKPDRDPRPLIDAWFKATPQTYKEVADSFQQRFDKEAAEWDRRVAEWKTKSDEARAKDLPIPSRPGLKDGEVMFLRAVLLDRAAPFSLPEKWPEPDSVKQLTAQMATLREASPPEPPMACAVTEGEPVKQRVFVRGDAGSPGDPVTAAVPEVLTAANPQPEFGPGSGRLEFAKWIASPKNPLTARVMVNRIWQGHFGEGLVRTPSNYGILGSRPTHPELLDYLASQFIAGGWSIKAMHRAMMLTATYQQSSDTTREKAEEDPENKLLSHFSRQRLDVEEIRDAMLAMDGSLDLTMGGTLQSGTGTDGENDSKRLSINPNTTKRRTVYLPLRRSNLPTLLNLFDFGDATTTCEGRDHTNVAPQALFMMNAPFVEQRAVTLSKEVPDVAHLYLRVLGRHATGEEIAEANEYIAKRGFKSFARVLLASNEFIYVD